MTQGITPASIQSQRATCTSMGVLLEVMVGDNKLVRLTIPFADLLMFVEGCRDVKVQEALTGVVKKMEAALNAHGEWMKTQVH